jgi:hypothetical protein
MKSVEGKFKLKPSVWSGGKMWARLVPGCGYLSSGDPHTPVGNFHHLPLLFGHPPTTKEDDKSMDRRRIKM